MVQQVRVVSLDLPPGFGCKLDTSTDPPTGLICNPAMRGREASVDGTVVEFIQLMRQNGGHLPYHEVPKPVRDTLRDLGLTKTVATKEVAQAASA